MTRDRLVSVFVSLAAVTVATVVVWIVFFRHPLRTVERVQGTTTVLVAPPMTPLPRDSGPKNNGRKARGRSPKASTDLQGESPSSRPTGGGVPKSGTRTGARSPKTRRTPRRKPSRPPSPQSGSQPSPSPSPAPQPRPLVGVTVPAPVSACVDRLAGVNCP